jgi:hypothetical protein
MCIFMYVYVSIRMFDQIGVDGFDAPLDWGKSGILMFMYMYISVQAYTCAHIYTFIYIYINPTHKCLDI